MILEIIAEQNPQDFQELLDDSQKYPQVKEYIASDNNNQILIHDMQDTVISMINDGLISGIISPLKYVTLIKFNGLTISGFQYLKKLKNELNKNEINALLKQSDLSLTPSNLTKVISKIIFS